MNNLMFVEIMRKKTKEMNDKRFMEDFEYHKKWFDQLSDERKKQVIKLLTEENRPV